MKTIQNAFHVQWITPREEETVASFWIGDRRMTADQARVEADLLAAQLNAKIPTRKAKKGAT
jgi:hypothetical protein